MGSVTRLKTAVLPDTPIAALHQAATAVDPNLRDACRRRQEANNAASIAVFDLATDYATTLGAVLTQLDVTGYPAVGGRLPCAVAWLGGAAAEHASWWVTHTRGAGHDQNEFADLTLIAPCACGTYCDVTVEHEDDLIDVLAELPTLPGEPVPCDWRLRIRRSSRRDPRHAQTQPGSDAEARAVANAKKPGKPPRSTPSRLRDKAQKGTALDSITRRVSRPRPMPTCCKATRKQQLIGGTVAVVTSHQRGCPVWSAR